ncbi:ABC transporter permease [Paenibacillus brevis]|uniref:FtsX-like permease family protein n=1 Tax=Paenibacillus brevis TaxID=2841508 RepID=A0ABS6FJV7_9BACL|nr:FtsX-like permease family protein [Paenibacillus brevis]MBU5670465.1 FtsX-like permease family protein [Paenibacillus brevis]
MHVLKLAFANIRKTPSAALSLALLILISTLLLNIGLTVLFSLQVFYEQKVEELQEAHAGILMRQEEYQPEQLEYLSNYPGAVKALQESVLLLQSARFQYSGSELSSALMVVNAGAEREFPNPKFSERLESLSDEDIYLPYRFKVGGGYKLGDTFTLKLSDQAYSFRIAGFYESALLGNIDMGMIKFMLPERGYHELENELGEQAEATFLSVRLENSDDAPGLIADYSRQFGLDAYFGAGFFWTGDVVTVKSANTMTVNIVAMILIAFAAIIVAVSLIVIHFRIINSIDDGMVNIGILKSLGYTSREIRGSMILQFTGIAAFSGVIGLLLSYLAMPVFGGIISSLAGLLWTTKLEVPLNLASLLLILLTVLAVTRWSSRRIHKLQPVEALRGGMAAHSFRKNCFPLDQSGGSVIWMLAGKTMLGNLKQNILISLIIAAVTFASVFAVMLYYNIGSDRTAFIHLVGSETADVVVITQPGTDSRVFMEEVQAMDGVAKLTIQDILNTEVEGRRYYTQVTEDFSRLDNDTFYKGRYPKYANEIGISGAISKEIGKGIGDQVTVNVQGRSETYLITGLSQSINFLGLLVSMTTEGMEQLAPDYESSVFNVYLDHEDTKGFIAKLQGQMGNRLQSVTDLEEVFNSQSSIYTAALFSVMLLILSITAIVVILILYLVIKTMILKRRRELGIFKAIGFTTLQLMNQIALSFVPVVAAGIVLGGFMGYLLTNPLLAFLLSGVGIFNVHFSLPLSGILLLGAGMIALSYIVSVLVSYRIKHISTYELITE